MAQSDIINSVDVTAVVKGAFQLLHQEDAPFLGEEDVRIEHYVMSDDLQRDITERADAYVTEVVNAADAVARTHEPLKKYLVALEPLYVEDNIPSSAYAGVIAKMRSGFDKAILGFQSAAATRVGAVAYFEDPTIRMHIESLTTAKASFLSAANKHKTGQCPVRCLVPSR